MIGVALAVASVLALVAGVAWLVARRRLRRKQAIEERLTGRQRLRAETRRQVDLLLSGTPVERKTRRASAAEIGRTVTRQGRWH